MTHGVQLIDTLIGGSLQITISNAVDKWLMDGHNLVNLARGENDSRRKKNS